MRMNEIENKIEKEVLKKLLKTRIDNNPYLNIYQKDALKMLLEHNTDPFTFLISFLSR